MSAVVQFYSGKGTDHRGRTLKELNSLTEIDMEQIHDYIQWIFPSDESSMVLQAAPVLTEKDQLAFRRDVRLRISLRKSFMIFMIFLGLEYNPTSGLLNIINKGKLYRKVMTRNHNWQRITRVLRCLNYLGLKKEAQALFNFLSDINNITPFNPITFDFWQKAMEAIRS